MDDDEIYGTGPGNGSNEAGSVYYDSYVSTLSYRPEALSEAGGINPGIGSPGPDLQLRPNPDDKIAIPTGVNEAPPLISNALARAGSAREWIEQGRYIFFQAIKYGTSHSPGADAGLVFQMAKDLETMDKVLAPLAAVYAGIQTVAEAQLLIQKGRTDAAICASIYGLVKMDVSVLFPEVGLGIFVAEKSYESLTGSDSFTNDFLCGPGLRALFMPTGRVSPLIRLP